MLMAMAAPIGGRPTLMAAGRSSAPTRAMAGEGQMIQATIRIVNPMTQNATAGVFMMPWMGLNIMPAMPVSSSILAMATMSEMMTTTPRRSLAATVMELNTAWTALIRSPVMTQDRTSEPTMQTIGVSRRKLMVTRISTMN